MPRWWIGEHHVFARLPDELGFGRVPDGNRILCEYAHAMGNGPVA